MESLSGIEDKFTGDYRRTHKESKIEYRLPNVSKDFFEHVSPESLEREWTVLADIVQKEISKDYKVRQILIKSLQEPVSEEFPNRLINALGDCSPVIAKAQETYKGSLVPYLAMPAVPDAQMKDRGGNDNLRQAINLPDIDSNIRKRLKQGISGIDLKAYVEAGYFTKGITPAEQAMTLMRYRFARDLKMLALAAELTENPVTNDTEKIITKNGIEISLDANDADVRQRLLQPSFWKGREQKKDRVYEIGEKYLLKERKTKRHRDTNGGGHQRGQPSAGEHAVSRFFQKETTTHGNVSLSFEKAFAHVTFPDTEHFQFALFEREEGLLSEKDATSQLVAAIEQNESDFREEHLRIKQSLNNISSDLPGIRRYALQKEFDFSAFARVKAAMLKTYARDLLQVALYKNKFENADLDGYKFRVHLSPLRLEIVAFDFEQYHKNEQGSNPNVSKFLESRARNDQEGIRLYSWAWSSRDPDYESRRVTQEEAKAFIIMLSELRVQEKTELLPPNTQ